MNCSQCQDFFSSHLDGELAGSERGEFIAHLADCGHCAADYQFFERTVASLHTIPESRPPADFIPGIHAKLAQPSPGKFRRWFSLLGQHKMAASTALATMMIAVISATVMQLEGPAPSSTGLTQADSGQAQQEMMASVASDVAAAGHNYYPGVPYLNPAPATTAQADRAQSLVNFASIPAQTSAAGYRRSMEGRAPPSLFSSSYQPLAADVNVSIHPTTLSQQHALIRQLVNQSSWLPQMQGNTIYIKMPASQLSSLQRMFAPADPHICQADLARLSDQQHSNRLLNIAVTFR